MDEINEYGKKEFQIQTQEDLVVFLNNMRLFNNEDTQQSTCVMDDVVILMDKYIKEFNEKDPCFQHFSQWAYVQIKDDNYKADLEQEIIRLKQLDSFKDKVLANVSHDLRTPLNTIIYIIEQQIEHCLQQSGKEQLSIAKTNAFLLLNLINDILDHCLLKERKMKIVAEEINIFIILKEINDIFSVQAGCRNIKFKISHKLITGIIIETDAKRLKQIIINLISNAMKFTTSGYVELIVNEDRQNKLVLFFVYDTGSGMTQAVINQLGQPFATFGNKVNQNSAGIGLGLNLSKQLLGLLGPSDNFEITSEVGKGSIFSFKIYKNLNKNVNQLQQSDSSESNEIISENSINQFCSFHDISPKQLGNLKKPYSFINLPNIEKTEQIQMSPHLSEKQNLMNQNLVNILIADDNPFNLLVLEQKLQITKVFNGKQAYEHFLNANNSINANNYPIIFMDCEMPIMNGYEATKIIKQKIQKEGFNKTIIIGSTALIDKNVLKMAREYLMDEVIPKPISIQELEKILNNFIQNL